MSAQRSVDGYTSGTSPVYLVDLVCFVYLVHLVYSVSLDQPNKQDKPKKPTNGLLALADFFSILLENPLRHAHLLTETREVRRLELERFGRLYFTPAGLRDRLLQSQAFKLFDRMMKRQEHQLSGWILGAVRDLQNKIRRPQNLLRR